MLSKRALVYTGNRVLSQQSQVFLQQALLSDITSQQSCSASTAATGQDRDFLDNAISPTVIQRVQQCLRHKFSDHRRLQIALLPAVHVGNLPQFRRLAWIGDAALHFCTTKLLEETYRSLNSKSLNRLRVVLVSRKVCAHRLTSLDAVNELFIAEKDRPNVHAEVFEAILGALDADGGLKAVDCFLQDHWPLPEKSISLVTRLKAKELWLNAPDYTNFDWGAAPPSHSPKGTHPPGVEALWSIIRDC